MAKSRFEVLIEKEVTKGKDGLAALPLDGDLSLRHAKLAGHIEGLTVALSLFKKAELTDDEEMIP